MRKSNYDFSGFYRIFGDMLANGKCSNSHTRELQKELNRFFDDSECTQVVFSENGDKMFFGMRVQPEMNANEIYDYLMGNDNVRISKYMLEIDGKLLNPMLELDAMELTAMVVHEVGHVVNDSAPITAARQYLDCYLADNRETLKISDSIHYKEILMYGLKDFISKYGSMFYSGDVSEVMADDFVHAFGLSEALESAMKKVMSNNIKLYENTAVSRGVVFAWTLRLYRNMAVRRVPALRMLNKMKFMTGSKIEQLEMKNLAMRIQRIDNDSLLEFSIPSPLQARMAKNRRDMLRSIDDDYYEYNMRVRNVEDEDDALYLLRHINTRLAIMEDYINDPRIDSKERQRWVKVKDKFLNLREQLTRTATYKSKTYGLFVAYPDIKPDNY
ncbi:hypothetical protein [uncultured Duncaniella sp.]|uniref:hypothetical protein n=1 Tax=uncultured Duncaniella sp. TaxID=2768039 RepID=UPI002615B628|nr:hypothetical protein [uncultured Duncaniella sp.]